MGRMTNEVPVLTGLIRWLTKRTGGRATTEMELCFNRLGLSALFCAYFSYLIEFRPDSHAYAANTIRLYLVAATGVSLLFIAWVALAPKPRVWRRYLGQIADTLLISTSLHVFGEFAAVAYGAYFWMHSGNGFRYGSRYLASAHALSVVSFALVIAFTPAWARNGTLATGLLVALLIAPLYVYLLLRREEKIRRRLRAMSQRDSLTGLSNRRAMRHMLDREIAAHRRHGRAFAVLLLDLDHFKRVNDEHGHLAGDEVLRAFSERLNRFARASDWVARYGGEEFVLALGGANLEEALHAAERLRQATARGAFPVRGGSVSLTLSIGATTIGPADLSPEGILARADEALYLAKNGGRNRVVAIPPPGLATAAFEASAGPRLGRKSGKYAPCQEAKAGQGG